MGFAEGKQKYSRKTGPGGPGAAKFNASKGTATAHWVESLSKAGQAPGPVSTAAYQSGIASAQYRGGDPEKWERRTREGLSR